MSVWWGREQRSPRVAPPGAKATELVEAKGLAIARAVRERVPRFAPSWRGAGQDDDAGEAFVRIYGELAASLGDRINRLPRQAEVELFRAAGVMPLLGLDALAIVQLRASEAARAPIFVGKGFRLGANPVDGSSDRVELETERDLYVSPGRLVRARVQRGPFHRDVTVDDVEGESFAPFSSESARRDEALWLGIAGTVHPGRRLTFAFGAAPRPTPRPQSASPDTAPPSPLLLTWETWSGAARPATVILDETQQFQKSGLIELSLPAEWRPSLAPDGSGEPLYWLRVRLQYGEPEEPMALRYVLLDCTRVRGAATFIDRRLEPVPGTEGRRWRFPALPVAHESEPLELSVDNPTAALTGEADPRWREVSSLDDYGPRDRVFELDHADGIATFGDGIHGASLPPGFDHVSAPRFRVSFGARAAVAAQGITTLLSNAPLLLDATNPLPATGGQAPESRGATLERAPLELRARGRAVAVRDVELLALQTPGALVRRAHAVPGHRPERPGVSRPGLVGVYVLGEPDANGKPAIDEPSLRAVAEHLQANGPAGIEVVTAAPRLLSLSADLAATVAVDADATTVIARLLTAIDQYFNPYVGQDGHGWPFGGAIRHADALTHLVSLPGVEAVDQLTFIVDGQRHRACTDITLPAHTLLWPGDHRVIVTGGRR